MYEMRQKLRRRKEDGDDDDDEEEEISIEVRLWTCEVVRRVDGSREKGGALGFRTAAACNKTA